METPLLPNEIKSPFCDSIQQRVALNIYMRDILFHIYLLFYSENGMPENEETKAILSSLYNTMAYLG